MKLPTLIDGARSIPSPTGHLVPAGGPRERSTIRADRVSVSGEGGAVLHAKGDEETARAERTKRLAAAIQAGTYIPDLGLIADRMLDEGELASAFEAQQAEQPE